MCTAVTVSLKFGSIFAMDCCPSNCSPAVYRPIRVGVVAYSVFCLLFSCTTKLLPIHRFTESTQQWVDTTRSRHFIRLSSTVHQYSL